MRPAAPDPELIEWLWSIDGKLWSKANINGVRHGSGILAEVKNDHECGTPDLTVYCDMRLEGGHSDRNDHSIRGDLYRYGISGVPEEWKHDRVVLHTRYTQSPHALHTEQELEHGITRCTPSRES